MARRVAEPWMTPIGPEVAYLGRAAGHVARVLGRTWRFRIEGREHESAARAASPRVIYALWHGRLMALTYAYRDLGIRVLVSRHRDGEILAHALGELGYMVSRGSSKRGGAEALLTMLSELRMGDVAITPDGPRGPRGALSPGVLALAQHSGAPILPVGCVASSAWEFGTWDRFLVPRPFASVAVRIGAPLWVGRELDAPAVAAVGRNLAASLERLSDSPAGGGAPE